MTPNRSHSDTVRRIANKVRVEGVENPYFYVPKYIFSDALPTPEIFFYTMHLESVGLHTTCLAVLLSRLESAPMTPSISKIVA